MKRNMEIISIPPTIPDLEMEGQFGNISTKTFFSIMMVRGSIGYKLNWNHYLDNGFWKIYPDYRDNNYAIISEARGQIPIPEKGWKFYYKDSNVYDETLTVNGTRFLKYFFSYFVFDFLEDLPVYSTYLAVKSRSFSEIPTGLYKLQNYTHNSKPVWEDIFYPSKIFFHGRSRYYFNEL